MDNYKNTNRIQVNGFCLAADELLLQIKNYFGLRSTLPLLKQIQRHFAVDQRREPLSDELLLIDAYLTSPPDSPSSFLLAELQSDDPRIGETYEDIRRKCSELEPKKGLPLDLGELFSLGGMCLQTLGKRSRRRIYSGEETLLSTMLTSTGEPLLAASSVSAAVVDIAPADKNGATPLTDCLVCLFPADSEMSERQFTLSIATLLADREGLAVGAVELTRTGFLTALLKISKGAYLDTAVLPEGDIVYGMKNGALVTLTGASAAVFAARAGVYGLDARICGRTDKLNRLTVTARDGFPMTLSAEFLRGARPKYSLEVNIPCRAAERTADEGFAIIGKHSFEGCDQTASVGDLTLTALGSRSLSFADAVLTLTEGVSRLVAAGVRYTDITASPDLALSDTPNGDGVGALLGLYRVQAELCLPTVGGRLSFDGVHFGVTLIGRARRSVPDRLQSRESRVYLLAPRTDSDGLPRFTDLRRLFEYVAEGIDNGSILSARAVGSAGVADALARFVGAEDPATLDIALPYIASLGFIAEAKDDLDGLLLGAFQ